MIPATRWTLRTLAAVMLGLVLLVSIWQKEASGRDLADFAGADDQGSPAGILAPSVTAAANCRYGVSAQPSQLSWLEQLGAGWYLDFHVRDNGPTEAEYVLTIATIQDKDANNNRLDTYTVLPRLNDDPGGLGWWLDVWPGAIWLVGNEPDRGPNPGNPTDRVQNDTMPDIYAQAYHEVYHFIKERNPQALVANAGLVEVTPGRLQYLDIVWDTYFDLYHAPMPVDIWNMHLYILPEVTPSGQPNGIANVALGTNPALGKRESGGQASQCPLNSVYCFAEHDDMARFAEQVEAMRTWMKDHGQRNKPLILSEFSILYPYIFDSETQTWFLTDENGNNFNPQRVTDFLEAGFAYLESAVDGQLGYPADGNRLVQQWLWYGVEVTGPGDASNLVNSESLTQMGQAYQDWVAAKSLYTNLLPDPPADIVAAPAAGQTTVTATLTADVRNNGTLRAGVPFSVTFYADEALSQVIGTAVVPAPGADFPGMTGCATRHVTVEVSWAGVGFGWHDYWIEVDSGGDIVEGPGGELDNVTQGRLLVPFTQLFLPTMPKN